MERKRKGKEDDGENGGWELTSLHRIVLNSRGRHRVVVMKVFQKKGEVGVSSLFTALPH